MKKLDGFRLKWNKELKEYLYINLNWDANSNQKIVVPYEKIYIPKDDDEEFEIKKNLSDNNPFLDDDMQWIERFNKWIKNISNNI